MLQSTLCGNVFRPRGEPVKTNKQSLRAMLAAATLCPALIGFGTSQSECAALPSSTTIPVYFTHTVKAGKAKAGDPVSARTMQVLILPDGQTLPAGTRIVGHVVDAQRFTFDPADYAVQKPSVLSIQFDKIEGKSLTIPMRVAVRALSNDIESNEARAPRYTDETDSVGTRVLVGGDQFYPLTKEVLSPDGDIVGYNRNQGVFARMIANTYAGRYSSFHCDGTNTEQSVGIFSASACGVYGYGTSYLSDNGSKGDGVFTLEDRHGNVQLNGQSAALLEVIGAQP